MNRKNVMNRNIALIIAAAMTVGQIPVSVFAEDYTEGIVETIQNNKDDISVLAEDYTYNQEYDNHSSTSWTSIVGGGTYLKKADNELQGDEDKTGYLEIKRDSSSGNNFVFLENQSVEVKDFEAEVRF